MKADREVIANRISRTREVMARHNIHTLILPTSDPHVTEYVPARWQGRRWLTGFTGSLGIAAVSRERTLLFVPALYMLQAEKELAGTDIELHLNNFVTPESTFNWISEIVPRGESIAVDGDVLPGALATALQQQAARAGAQLRSDIDLLDEAWSNRPAPPSGAIFAQPEPQATPTRAEKLADIRKAMAQSGASHHFISSLDDIAWLMNLRGSDIQCTPLFMAHLLLTGDSGTLFINQGSLPTDQFQALEDDGISVAPYQASAAALSALSPEHSLLLDPKKTTLGFRNAIGKGCRTVEATNPTTLTKCCKTPDELDQVRETMTEDGAALCEFYAWFEATLGRETITELTVDERMTEERARREGFVSLSFPTIAGFNGNGAMPHYCATPESHAAIEGNGLLLIDSGGQYLGGTTDITRVWPIGKVSAAQRRDYTMVLRANIALSRIRFPNDTLSTLLDAIARVPLWSEGMDYAHGTGHGVGYFLCVHEGPHTLRQAIPNPEMAMKPGMVTSIEPAVYRVGEWGVRHENLVANVPATTEEQGLFGEFLEFETLTLCPIDTRCIERSLMREDEIAWLNRYHATVRERLSPRVGRSARQWLEARTQPL
ncbi:MAG: aminopeptidase P family protein [Xanthomonadales bacterium]|nr:aminopeptidase P family protein [Xanthomonadales bacterium]